MFPNDNNQLDPGKGKSIVSTDISESNSSGCSVQPMVRQLPSDTEIGEIVQEIAYKQHHEEQADDYLEKIYILREWLLRQSA